LSVLCERRIETSVFHEIYCFQITVGLDTDWEKHLVLLDQQYSAGRVVPSGSEERIETSTYHVIFRLQVTGWSRYAPTCASINSARRTGLLDQRFALKILFLYLLGGRALHRVYRDVVPSKSEERIETTMFHVIFSFQVTVGLDTPRRTQGYSTNGLLLKFFLCKWREHFSIAIYQGFALCSAPILHLLFSIISIGYSLKFFAIHQFYWQPS